MSYEIRPVHYSEALFARIIAEAAERDGRFLLRLRDHWIDGSERFERPGEILLGAFDGYELAGTGGISHDPYEQEDGLGRVRHVYVLIEHRRRGIAGTLVRRLIEDAHSHFNVLRLHTSNPVAARFYERLGFKPSSQGRKTHRLKL